MLSTDIAPLVCVSAYWPHLSAISIRTHLERLFLASRMAGIVKTWRTAVNRGSLRFGSGVTTMERSNYRTNAAGNRGPLPLREPSISRRNTRATVTSGHRDERNNQTCRASFSVNPVGKRPRVVDGYRSNRRYDGRNDVEEARTSTTIARLRSMKQRWQRWPRLTPPVPATTMAMTVIATSPSLANGRPNWFSRSMDERRPSIELHGHFHGRFSCRRGTSRVVSSLPPLSNSYGERLWNTVRRSFLCN
mgnify:CR=1 FL=1